MVSVGTGLITVALACNLSLLFEMFLVQRICVWILLLILIFVKVSLLSDITSYCLLNKIIYYWLILVMFHSLFLLTAALCFNLFINLQLPLVIFFRNRACCGLMIVCDFSVATWLVILMPIRLCFIKNFENSRVLRIRYTLTGALRVYLFHATYSSSFSNVSFWLNVSMHMYITSHKF